MGSALWCWPTRYPAPEERVRLRVDDQTEVEFAWGRFWEFGTPAYWVSQYLGRYGRRPMLSLALGRSLLEETAACLLGGHGVPAEIGLAAFQRMRDEGLLSGAVVPADRFLALLSRPLSLSGRTVCYRFAAQRSKRLAAATRYFVQHASPREDQPLAVRDWLLRVPGVGLKTASWIVRNRLGCNEVAIIDVHIRRAGIKAGIFRADWRLPRDYLRFERAFLLFAQAGTVPASGLDALIWDEQRIMTSPRVRASLLPPGGDALGPLVACESE